MKLVSLKCPECGVKVEVSDKLKQFTCNYCGATTLIDDEVIKVEHRIVSNRKEEKLKDADFYLENGEYSKAYDILNKLSKEHARDTEIYWKLVLATTNNFKRYDSHYAYYNKTAIDCNDVFAEYEKRETDYQKLEENKELYEKWRNEVDEYLKEKEISKNKRLKEASKTYTIKIIILLLLIILTISIGLITKNKTITFILTFVTTIYFIIVSNNKTK